MIGGLIAVAIAIWFYRTAIDIHDPNPFKWAINGVVAYYVVVFLWWMLVLKPASATLHHQNQALLIALHYGGTILGVAVAWFIRSRWVASVEKKES